MYRDKSGHKDTTLISSKPRFGGVFSFLRHARRNSTTEPFRGEPE
nr:MAG TPA_asm: hypothetical protein [Caudoviricetes sp.]